MSKAQVIRFNGAVVALVVDGEAHVTDDLADESAGTVKGMCLFAMEVQAGAIDPPYSDARALSYARMAAVGRARSAGHR